LILDPVTALEELVAIPSVNPMGGALSGPPLGEARLTDHLERVFTSLGLAVERQTAEPGRENILARLDGGDFPDPDAPLILLDAHQDTVPVEGMTVDPFRPERRGGRLYGRGACDTKGGMAAMLAALSRLAARQPSRRATILAVCTVNEEHGFSGAEALVRLWTDPAVRSRLVPRRPDVAVILEPTELNAVVAHKGVIRWRCLAPGRAAHSSRPELGENAIYKMARVVAALERCAKEVLPRAAAHLLCGPPTLSVGTIHGGIGPNIVPDRCTIEIDLRVPPGMDPDAARNLVIEYLAQSGDLGFAPEHEPPMMRGMPLMDRDNGPWAARLLAALGGSAKARPPSGVPYATDAGHLSAAGVPAVVFGPGSPAQAHAADEWIDLDQVRQAVDVLEQFCSV